MYYIIAKRVVEPRLIENYKLVSAYSKDTQTILNKKANMNRKGVQVPLNQDRIDCTVNYLPGNGKKQDVWSKKWTYISKDDNIKKRKEMNNGPRVLHKEDILTENFTRGSGKNYPIKFVGSDHVKFDAKEVKKVTVIAGKKV
ncbi:MAG: hypothetical protein Q4B36_04890 [Tissierellia bacterium]|nr:hypothetical protein [Tissierellia bacterium]